MTRQSLLQWRGVHDGGIINVSWPGAIRSHALKVFGLCEPGLVPRPVIERRGMKGSHLMSVSPRTRFEIFKRDSFTCQYCGIKSPEVVLEVDHITPRADGGTDDRMNLTTSCWDCNCGKSSVSLSEVMTGEDPHDAAVLLLEKRRQLDEYNHALKLDLEARESEHAGLVEYWLDATGWTSINPRDSAWLMNVLTFCPSGVVRNLMGSTIAAQKTLNMAYLNACIRRWRKDGAA